MRKNIGLGAFLLLVVGTLGLLLNELVFAWGSPPNSGSPFSTWSDLRS